MTEAEWLACTDPYRMAASRHRIGRACGWRASRRKLQLFGCACVRRAWGRLHDERCRWAVAVCESLAEGTAGKEELAAVRQEVGAACDAATDLGAPEWRAMSAVRAGLGLGFLRAASLACLAAAGEPRRGEGTVAEEARQADLLRDVLGNPFRGVAISPACLTDQVVALAQAAYDEREMPAGTLDPARLAVLADALEDAGCGQADLLTHLRGPGPHVRGCWTVDLILGKG